MCWLSVTPSIFGTPRGEGNAARVVRRGPRSPPGARRDRRAPADLAAGQRPGATQATTEAYTRHYTYEDTAYTYDPNGNPLTTDAWLGTANSRMVEANTYDAAGNLTTTTDATGATTRFTYDPAGNRESTTTARGNQSGAYPAAFTWH